MIDIDIRDEGSIFLFTPETDAGKKWIQDNTGPVKIELNSALVVEHRYAAAIMEGMVEDGLTLRYDGEGLEVIPDEG